ncbi:MAG TPA: nucleotide sugar dehydrogenase [Verrucomicrobia bacterium]|nr:nucleotide sugar dehydrogenase [Verrucomicrobiota bacterium]
MTELKKIAVIGCWHQGVVGAACLASLGYDVLGADADGARVEKLNRGQAPLFEPGLDDLLKKETGAGRLRFTTDMAGAVKDRDYVLVMFDTPVDENDRSDLSGVFAAVQAIAPNLRQEVVVYVTAQLPVGTCDQLRDLIRKTNPSLKFGLAYSPENLRLGQAIDRFLHPALPVIGAEEPETLDRVEQLFSPLNVKWHRVNLRTAEMTKHALNAFLATSVTFANELGNLCDEVGADGSRLAEVLRLEPRVGPKAMLLPGLGFSGGTLARDMQTLRELGDRFQFDTKLLDGVWMSNRQQNQLVIRKLKKSLGELAGRRVAVLGLTYKPDTSTLRRSASLEIIGDMVREQMAVTAHDPKADRGELAQHSEFKFFENVYDAVQDAEAVVLITGWAEYKTLDYAQIKSLMKGTVLIDTQNMLNGDRMMALGFRYLDIGRGRVAGGST